jgi:hypothetical protein
MHSSRNDSGRKSRCPLCGLSLEVVTLSSGPELRYDFPVWDRLCKRPALGGPSMCLAGMSVPAAAPVDRTIDGGDPASTPFG